MLSSQSNVIIITESYKGPRREGEEAAPHGFSRGEAWSEATRRDLNTKSGPLTSARVKLHDVLLLLPSSAAAAAAGVEVDVAGTRLVHQLAGVAARRPALPPVPRGGAAGGRTQKIACNWMIWEKIFISACIEQATDEWVTNGTSPLGTSARLVIRKKRVPLETPNGVLNYCQSRLRWIFVKNQRPHWWCNFSRYSRGWYLLSPLNRPKTEAGSLRRRRKFATWKWMYLTLNETSL